MTGPNDVRHVVWALGELFLFSSCFFFVLNDLHRYFEYSKGRVWFNAGNNDDNGPKQRVSRRLGLLSSLLPVLNHTVPLEYSKFLCKSLSTKKKHEENKKELT